MITFLRGFSLSMCQIPLRGVDENELKMKYFPFCLKEDAHDWFLNLEPDSIKTWEELEATFTNYWHSPEKTRELREKILRFEQQCNEEFHTAYDRFNNLLRHCPNHGFTDFQLMETFYGAMNPDEQRLIEVRCGGSISSIELEILRKKIKLTADESRQKIFKKKKHKGD